MPLVSFFQALRSSRIFAPGFSPGLWPQPVPKNASATTRRSSRMLRGSLGVVTAGTPAPLGPWPPACPRSGVDFLLPVRAQRDAVPGIASAGPRRPGDARGDAADAAVPHPDHQGAGVGGLHDAKVAALH